MDWLSEANKNKEKEENRRIFPSWATWDPQKSKMEGSIVPRKGRGRKKKPQQDSFYTFSFTPNQIRGGVIIQSGLNLLTYGIASYPTHKRSPRKRLYTA
jgi:hypothetical protein